MSEKHYDAIVIGAGIAGLATAALLAKDHARRVLVLERAPWVGGRALSYVGRGNVVEADGITMDAAAFRKSLAHAHCYLGKCEPAIEEIFARSLLDGRTFEAGGHGLFWGNASRCDALMRHLGVGWSLPLNRGFGFVKWHGEGAPTEHYQVQKGKPYPWMSAEGYASTIEQLGEMARTTPQQLAQLMTTPLSAWLEQRGMHPEAYEYIKVLAASQTAQAEPAMTPAGDFLGYMAVAPALRMNLVSGSVATADEPGTIAIALLFEKVLKEHGGEVRRATPVREVLIDENGRAVGVRIREKGADGAATERELRADAIVCTVPPKYVFDRLLPKERFPPEFVDFMSRKSWGAGLLTGWYGMSAPQFPDIGIAEGSFVYMPGITRPEEGFIGVVDMIMADMNAWGDGSARRAPPGKHEYYFSTALTDAEMRDPKRVGRVIELCEAWAKRTFPNWERSQEFCIWTPGPEAYGTWRPVGSERPDVASPHVERLFFAGDQYGRRLWGGGVDGASLSAVLCVDAMTGGDAEGRIMPEWHRGLPRA